MAGGFTERLYMNNYCWENLKDFDKTPGAPGQAEDFEAKIDINGDRKTFTREGITESGDMGYHRSFVLAMLFASFICILPSIVWAVIDYDKDIKVQGDYIEVGVEEAFQLVLKQMVALVKHELATEGNEMISGVPVKKRLQEFGNKIRSTVANADGSKTLPEAVEEKEKNVFNSTDAKFGCFAKLIQVKLQSKLLVRSYLMKRLVTVVLITIASYFLYSLYIAQNSDFFDCRVPFSPLQEIIVDGQKKYDLRENGVEIIARCGLDGVGVRIFLIKLLLAANAVGLLFCLSLMYTENSSCKSCRNDFRMMTESAFISDNQKSMVISSLSSKYISQTDFDLLLFMTMNNLENENNKMFQICKFALRSARASCAFGANATEEGISEAYFDHLYGIVARSLDDDSEEVKKVSANVTSD